MTKKSFILYTEYEELINQLSDEQSGQLIKSVFSYNNNGELPEEFDEIRKKYDLDTDRKIEEYAYRRSHAGSG